MCLQAFPSVRITVIAAAFVTLSVCAFGQTGRSPSLNARIQLPLAEATEAVRRLSVGEAVQLALLQNLGIQIQRLDPQIQDVGIAQARSLWTPHLSSNLLTSSEHQPATSLLSGAPTSVSNGQISTSVAVNQQLPWGGSYNGNWNNFRQTTTDLFANFSPQLQSGLSLTYTQPLLRNFKTDQMRQQVAVAKKERERSDFQLHAVIVQTIRDVKNAYWDLVSTIDNLKAQRESLEFAQQSLKDTERLIQIGAMAPIDILSPQAEAANNEQSVIVAKAAIAQAEDRLRALIFDPAIPDFWAIRLDPTDTTALEDQDIDVNAAVRNALDKRTDLLQAKSRIEQGDVAIRYSRNQILPDVNAQANYSMIGIGGALLQPVDLLAISQGIVQARSVLAERSFGSVLGDLVSGSFPQWTFSVQIGYPLASSTAQANLARAKLQYSQAQAQLKILTLEVTAQVREAARRVQTNRKRIDAVRAARVLHEKKLEAEQKKFAAGLSTSFFVFQAQRDLAQTRNAEIQATSDFNKSVADFEAVQEISLAGGAASATTTRAGAAVLGGNTVFR